MPLPTSLQPQGEEEGQPQRGKCHSPLERADHRKGPRAQPPGLTLPRAPAHTLLFLSHLSWN